MYIVAKMIQMLRHIKCFEVGNKFGVKLFETVNLWPNISTSLMHKLPMLYCLCKNQTIHLQLEVYNEVAKNEFIGVCNYCFFVCENEVVRFLQR